MTESLLTTTKALLERDRGNWPATARDTGLDYNWLQKLAQGKIDDPGVNKIECLHNYLATKYSEAA